VRAFTPHTTHLGFDEFDIANQGLISHHYELIDGVWRVRSVPCRYVWPSELDRMARADDARGALGRLAPRAVHA
jgi:hypothetical protein